ncbi:MAG: aminoacetone oxidase family FAD-binding enzyme [Lachnospiraceae bacterium]|nr:aminoacetone oxidase family FAD-binding enzyme [Lachnospiraceae bacterium]
MKIAIAGAGASGMAAAISAARAGASVTIYEHKDSAANKLLITGNGKCNFTNIRMEPSCFHSSTDREKRTEGFLERFGTGECIRFFESLGVMHRERKGGIYPYSDTAEAVRRAFLMELKRLGVSLVYNCGDISVTPELCISGRRYDRIIIACGSCVSKKTGSDGSGYEMLRHLGVELTPVYPALTPLLVKEDLSSLKGVRCDAALKLMDGDGNARESSSGELQPFDKGLSGICAMDISGQACRMLGAGERAFVEADLFPLMPDEELKSLLIKRRETFPERNPSELLNSLFPKKLADHLVHPVDTRREDWIDTLCRNIKHHRYELSPDMIRDFSRAQTAAGGVPMTSIDKNCMLTGHEGIYVTGELLDTDGICGGYNLHFAFMTGILAGEHSAAC